GGTYVIPSILEKKIRPAELLDISGVVGLKRLEVEAGVVRAGTLTTLAELAEHFLTGSEAFRNFMERYTSPAIVNIATVGGSIALRSSTEDIITILLVHDTYVKLHSDSGVLEIPLEEFLEKDQGRFLIEEIRFRDPSSVKTAFDKISMGISYIPMVSASVGLDVDRGGEIVCRVATSYRKGELPGRVHEAEDVIHSKGLTEDAVEEAARAVEASMEPVSDLIAPAWFRRRAGGVLVKRLLKRLAGG
ncbi:MAG: FAD binding domain-containing protein, partial [Nitrososphaerota archaeon]